MIKRYLWAFTFCACSIFTPVRAQDMDASVLTSDELNFRDIASIQRNAIFSGIDTLKKLSFTAPLRTSQDSVIYSRLRKIQRSVPLAFNEQIKSYIETYSSRNYNPYLAKLDGLSQYYFPIYEQIFREAGVPEEMKYLSVIESSLNPHLVSRAGAVGLWQFMYATAKEYDLTMNNAIDERKDPYAAGVAASRYFKESYAEFGDWLLVLASYNCGKGGVRRAIKRSGLHNPDFWQLSPYLPKETRNYIPKFIAMNYVLKHASEYNIEAIPSNFAWIPKPVMVEHNVDLNDVARAVNLPIKTLKEFNPAIKKETVVASATNPIRVIVPKTAQLNDSLLYVALNHQFDTEPSQQLLASARVVPQDQPGGRVNIVHVAKRGESLSTLAAAFQVTVQDLRAWNDLSNDARIEGRELIVNKTADKAFSTRIAAATNIKKVPAKSNKTKLSYLTHTVRRGETLSHIASSYKGSTVTTIKSDNRLKNSKLRIGQKLKIRKIS
ncbi:MAG: transglycosylase SLT domain-containing protein [Sphingobacterium sp.]|uniref:LysM peptidoglycan-binding domain-containing protein n=1 Tax=Sphingobacterium sp. JB170 TaxID=1434842 RepID=UPI00097F45D2|nr:LysM peptidoglycan-binding domain-containing protein [Sphingobacterium sp. JB170]SJN25890.1 Membrane-bound lytic murein transglycosylase D precursor [Sphingobacterium sp. JB170]